MWHTTAHGEHEMKCHVHESYEKVHATVKPKKKAVYEQAHNELERRGNVAGVHTKLETKSNVVYEQVHNELETDSNVACVQVQMEENRNALYMNKYALNSISIKIWHTNK